MKKLLLIPLLGFLSLQAVENQYFSLEQKAQAWLKDEKTQKYIIRNRDQIIAILEQDNRGGIVLDAQPFAITADEVEELHAVFMGMTDVILGNAIWNMAHELNYEDAYEKIKGLAWEEYTAAFTELLNSVAASYPTIAEFDKKHMQAQDAGTLEACEYLKKLINDNESK